MKFGITMFPADYAIGPVELGRAAEERGFESLFFPEHTHIPANRRTPYPGRGDLPEMYWHTHDPFVALAAVAATTQQLKVGTGICLLVERDPIITAKEVASLDRLSDGRFLFGVGAGWNREEMANHGTDARTRMALLAERVHAMKAIWTEDEAAYHGKYVDFDPIWSWPKPVQQPHPPVLVGGMGKTVLDRVLDFGDEWFAQNVKPDRTEPFARRVAELQRRAAESGRKRIPVSLFSATADADAVRKYAEAGVDRCIFSVPAAGADQVLPLLDKHADVVASLG
jgi:probable F420-dependent oxidoreductase